jgi:hypothetical protein
MARTERAIPQGDAADLERLRQVTARIRARAAELGRTSAKARPALPELRKRDPVAPPHWSDGPESSPEDDRDGED